MIITVVLQQVWLNLLCRKMRDLSEFNNWKQICFISYTKIVEIQILDFICSIIIVKNLTKKEN